MPKVADVQLSWNRSPSADVTAQRIEVTTNGGLVTADLGKEVDSYLIQVPANGTVQFKVIVLDDDGNAVESSLYTFSIGDLVAPLPATELTHKVISVRDVEDTPPEQPTEPVEEPTV